MAIFGHCKFIPVFLGKVVRKNLEQLFLAISNLYQSFWKKFGMGIFGHCKFIPVFLGKIQKKFGRAIFGHSEFIPVFVGKIIKKKSEYPFLAFLNLYNSFWEKFLEEIWNGLWNYNNYI